MEINIERNDDGSIDIEYIPRYSSIDGWMEFRNYMGFNEGSPEKVHDAVEIVEEEKIMRDGYQDGAERVVLRFESLEAVSEFRSELYSKARELRKEGATDIGDKMIFIDIPTTYDIFTEVDEISREEMEEVRG